MHPLRLGLFLMAGLLAFAVFEGFMAPRRQAAAQSPNLVHLNPGNFEAEVLKAPGLVLVDFYADWCGPCRKIAPSVASLADTFKDKVKVGKLNTDQASAVATAFGVRGIPCLILFRKGEEVDRKVGAYSYDDYQAWIEQHLGAS